MALNVFMIPLVNVPQRFEISLNGRAFIMQNRYNPEIPGWVISMFDGDTNEELFSNLPMVTGVNLLAQYKHLNIDGEFYLYTDGNEFTPPTETNLGAECNLYYLVEQ